MNYLILNAIHYERKDYDIFDLLSYTEIEDLVALYLQIEKDLVFVPSSRGKRNDTLYFEYKLISKKSKEYFAQVKSGNQKIGRNQYKDFPYPIYLFSPSGYTGSEQENTYSIKTDDLKEFMNDNLELLPNSFRNWMKIAKN